MLNSCIGAHLNTHWTAITIIIRQNELHHALNLRIVNNISRCRHTPTTYCVAKEIARVRVLCSKVYRLRLGNKNVKGHAILPLIPDIPLIVNQNINKPLSKTPCYISIMLI